MTLIELLRISAETYMRDFPDFSLLTFVNKATGEPLKRPPTGDLLARFVVEELWETYDAGASDDRQIAEAVRALGRARDDLDNMVSALERRRAV
jgi:hypothetical protein